jgi:Tfp pilus assembly protein PilN
VILTNLLPRRPGRIRIFGVAFDREIARAAFLGGLCVCGCAAGVAAVETATLVDAQRAAHVLALAVAADAPLRTASRRVALDIARYQEFARELALARHTGPDVARAIVRIGNAVPARVWLDTLVPVDGHVELTGTAESVDAVGTALDSLGRDVPQTATALVSLERRDVSGSELRFSARVTPVPNADAASTPQP